jgi:hypothetical protein
MDVALVAILLTMTPVYGLLVLAKKRQVDRMERLLRESVVLAWNRARRG